MKGRLMLLNVILKMMGMLLVSVMTIITFFQLAEAFTWTEVEEAGNLPGTAQRINQNEANEALEFITGSLSSPIDVDMYAIFITGGGNFSATTVGWTVDVDTQLTLYDSSGIGIYSNDDFDTDNLQSTLPAFNPLTPITPGLYYLAISDWDYDPLSDGGYIFPHPAGGLSDTAIDGPTGPGGGLPVTGWDGISTIGGGTYTIALTGATAVAHLPKQTNLPSILLLLLSD
jgi:hypothetical protein